MGMYTELVLQIQFKEDVPKSVLDTIRYMIGETSTPPAKPPFEAERWDFMLRCSSYYHFPLNVNVLERVGPWVLFSRSDFKNYDNEVKKFCEWIAPYAETSEYRHHGYYLYEEDEMPTFIRFTENGVEYRRSM